MREILKIIPSLFFLKSTRTWFLKVSEMLHDHIKVIKWSLNFMARLHCFPIIWDKDKIKFKKNLFFTRFFEIVQILYFVLILYVILIQVHADCGVQILFSLQVGLGLTMIYLWGMGVQLAKIGGTLLNTISAFEIWLKHNFGGIFSNMERWDFVNV